ncbi:MAG: EAL domain-containing protein [Actinomycetota bacterium]
MHSPIPHVRRVVAEVVAELDGRVIEVAPAVASVPSHVWAIVEDVLAAELTVQEQEEVRVATPVGPDDLTGLITAVPLSVRLARQRHEHLRVLLDEQRFTTHYQMIVDARSNAIVGFEGLLRTVIDDVEVWPDEAFAMAAEAGWTDVLDRIGREKAIAGSAGWLGDRDLYINFMPTSIYRPEHCLRTTWAAAERYGVAPERIVFEVTEGTDASPEHLDHILRHYREEGCRIAVDDVGAGYGSLNRLARIQPDVAKIDKQLVQDASPVSDAVIGAVVGLCRDLGVVVLAEGVETKAQADRVVGLGVELLQGFWLGRPMPAELQPTPNILMA